MTDVAALIADMVRAGVDPELIGRAAAAIVESAVPAQPTRTARQERNARYYAAKASEKRLNSSEPDVSDGNDPSPKKETSPAPLKEKTTPSQSETNVSSKTPRAALETVLDAARAGDVIEMRQRIRKPLTRRAAELLAGQLAQWHDPNEAADAMVLNAWQGFKPEYLNNQRARGSPAFSKPAKPDHFANFQQELIDGQDRDDRSDRSNRDDAQGVPVLTIDYHRG